LQHQTAKHEAAGIKVYRDRHTTISLLHFLP
jgi:hypothetical protein